MKRNYIVGLLMVLTTICTAKSQDLSKEKAIGLASSFFRGANVDICASSEDLPSVASKGATNADPYFYILNNESGKGFVIISTCNQTQPILGYSFEGNADINNIPESAEGWLLDLRKQIKDAKDGKIGHDPYMEALWNAPIKLGDPVVLLNTPTWSQSSPFNNQCPVKNGARCITGCVATAFGEIFKYYEWPKYGIGTTSAYKTGGIEVPSRDLNHEYDWDNILYSYSGTTTNANREAVAILEADIGAAIQADYDVNGTAAPTTSAALVSNFSYNKNAHLISKNSMTDHEWFLLIKRDIDKRQPLIYSGYNNSSGHCFVCDGYDSREYIHINWGWGGSYNGYFAISALNPYSSTHYNDGNEAIFDFIPDDGSDASDYHLLAIHNETGLSSPNTQFAKGGEVTINPLDIINCGLRKFSGVLAVNIVNKQGEIIETLHTMIISNLRPSYYMAYSKAKYTIKSDILPGYRIRLFYRITNKTEWIPLFYPEVTQIPQEILIAEDIDDSIERSTSFNYDKNAKTITLETKIQNLSVVLLNQNQSEITEGISTVGTTTTIDLSKLSNDTYTIRLSKNEEVKELKFSVKEQ